MLKSLKLVAIFLTLVAIGGGLFAYWRHASLYPSTQDAYVQAHIVTIAPEITGKVVAVHVAQNDLVKAGAPLFDIEATVYEDAVTQATAQVDSATKAVSSYKQQIEAANAVVESAKTADQAAQTQLGRVQKLFDDGNEAQAALDNAHTAAADALSGLHSAQAKLAEAQTASLSNSDTLNSAQAALKTAQYNLSQTKVTSPVEGWVSNMMLRKGTLVSAYAPLFSMVDNSEWWIDANFKEADLSRIIADQSVTISVDMLPGTTLTGKVGSIGRGSGSTFALLPAENASGNWVKVTQRFKTRISLNKTDPNLRVGASAKVVVDTTNNGTAGTGQ